MTTATELADLYDRAHDIVTAHYDIVPDDIKRQWPNALGTLRRVAGQRYHRGGPNGKEDPLTDQEASALRMFFHATIRRVEAKR